MRMFRPAAIAYLFCVPCLASCAANTRYSSTPVAKLTDEQLVEELASAAEGLGIAMDRTSYLIAVRPEPAYVLTSSTSTFAGTMTATYNSYSMPTGYGISTQGRMNGSIKGNTNTRYNYTDVNAGARLGSIIATAISQSRAAAYRRRGSEVWTEYQRRVTTTRAQMESQVNAFFSANPAMNEKRMLVAAVAPWAASEGATTPIETLRRTKAKIESLRRGVGLDGEWYGMFSQTSTTPAGEVFSFSEFVRLEFSEKSGKLQGKGMLGSGELIELDGTVSGSKIDAAVANTTSAINVRLSAIAATNQITGEFTGSGAGQTLKGTFVLLR